MLSGKFVSRLAIINPVTASAMTSRLLLTGVHSAGHQKFLKSSRAPILSSQRLCSSGSSKGKVKEVFPSFTSADNFTTFVKGPDIAVISSLILRGVPNPPFSKMMSESSLPELSNLKGLTPELFTEGALVAVELVTKNIREAMEPEARDEALAQLQWQLTPECFQKVLSVIQLLEENRESHKTDNVDLIPIHKDDIFFSWLASSNLVPFTAECRFLFCTISLKGYSLLKGLVEEQKAQRLAFTEELNRLKEDGVEAAVLKEKTLEFAKSLSESRPDVNKNSIVISNFMFTQKPGEENWTIDEIAMRDSTQAWSKFSQFRWRFRLYTTATKGVSFSSVLRVDYFTDWVVLVLFFNLTLYTLVYQA